MISKLLLLASFTFAAHTLALDVPPGFVSETLVEQLNCATSIAPLPDGRVLIADQTGPINLWEAKDKPLTTLINLADRLDTFWERGVIGLALHPSFPTDARVYVLYVAAQPHTHHVLSSFLLKGDVLDAASEKILLRGDDQAKLGGGMKAGHQGGVMKFGKDGCLYISLGEQTAGEPSQNLDTLQGKVLRIKDDGSVPSDNPFVSQTQEKYQTIYARGLRNSFGLGVQASTGRVFFTDVGGSAFEEINELKAGANYGWPRAEGKTEHTEFVQPLHAYPPIVGSSIVGAAPVPAGKQWPEKWQGKLLVADFMKHWIKGIDPDQPAKLQSLVSGLNGPVALEFAQDESLLVLNRGTIWRDPKKVVSNAGSLLRIRYAGESHKAAELPQGKGALELPLAAAALPQTISKSEWVALTSKANQPKHTPLDQEWHPQASAKLSVYLPQETELSGTDFPNGTVFVREFHTKDGQPLERRLILLAKPHGWAASYKMEANGDAVLLPDGELIALGKDQWYFPAVESQLTQPIFNLAYAVPLTASEWQADAPRWQDESVPVEARVRSYLAAHCACCHQAGGPSRGQFDARLHVALHETGLLNGMPIAGDLGIPGAKLVTAGDPQKSILYKRLAETGFFRMPPVAFHKDQSPILPLVEKWIKELKP
jgi:glucose/arabinose dehydrogenase